MMDNFLSLSEREDLSNKFSSWIAAPHETNSHEGVKNNLNLFCFPWRYSHVCFSSLCRVHVLILLLFSSLSAIHYNPSSRGLAVATSEQIALLPLKNKWVKKALFKIFKMLQCQRSCSECKCQRRNVDVVVSNFSCFICPLASYLYPIIRFDFRGPFLESPDNFSGPELELLYERKIYLKNSHFVGF